MLQQCKNCDNQSFNSTSAQLTTMTMSINTLHECQTFRTIDVSYHLWTCRIPWTIRTMDFSYLPWTFSYRSYHGLFVPSSDFSYRCENFSFFNILSRVSKVAIKVVGLRREHRARLMPKTTTTTNPPPPTTTPPRTTTTHADADDDNDDANAIPTFTTI